MNKKIDVHTTGAARRMSPSCSAAFFLQHRCLWMIRSQFWQRIGCTAGKCSCNRSNASVFRMSLRTTALQPQKPYSLLHVIANRWVAVQIPCPLLHVIARSGAAAPRRGNPRPRRSTKREAVPKANSHPSTNLPKPQPTCQVSLRGCGLPRRFAPRNDMQKYAACTHGNYVVPGQIRYAFRIRQGHCRTAPSALSAHSLPSESVTQQCTETQRTGKAPR